MISFMLGVLGSVTFWIVFALIGAVAGTVCMKKLCPNVFTIIKTGKCNWDRHPDSADYFHVFIVSITMYTFWPFIIISVGTFYLTKELVSKVIWPLFRSMVKGADKLVPKFKIVKED